MEKIITTLIAIIKNVKLRHWHVSISISLTANYEGAVVSSAGSPPFKPRPSPPPPWASDGESVEGCFRSSQIFHAIPSSSLLAPA